MRSIDDFSWDKKEREREKEEESRTRNMKEMEKDGVMLFNVSFVTSNITNLFQTQLSSSSLFERSVSFAMSINHSLIL